MAAKRFHSKNLFVWRKNAPRLYVVYELQANVFAEFKVRFKTEFATFCTERGLSLRVKDDTFQVMVEYHKPGASPGAASSTSTPSSTGQPRRVKTPRQDRRAKLRSAQHALRQFVISVTGVKVPPPCGFVDPHFRVRLRAGRVARCFPYP